jgi:PadR family transcriptional regulator AphA
MTAKIKENTVSLKHAILVLLETEPGSGYDLLKRFREHMGYFWNASHQQIYQQLKWMHEAGWLALRTEPQQGKPDRKVYELTLAGHDALLDWLAETSKPQKVNDSLLVRLYGGHLREADAIRADIAHHRKLYEQNRAALLSIEQHYLALPETERQRYRFPYLTLRRGILSVQAWLDWADEVDAFLNHQ